MCVSLLFLHKASVFNLLYPDLDKQTNKNLKCSGKLFFFNIKNKTPLWAHLKKKKKSAGYVQACAVIHSSIWKEVQQETGLDQLQSFGLFWVKIHLYKRSDPSASLWLHSHLLFFLFIYKKSTCRQGNKQPVSQVGANGNEHSVLRLVDQDQETKAVQQSWVILGGGTSYLLYMTGLQWRTTAGPT